MSRVFIGNIEPDVQEDELENVCGKYGTITDVWVARDPSGFAFVVRRRPRARTASLSLT